MTVGMLRPEMVEAESSRLVFDLVMGLLPSNAICAVCQCSVVLSLALPRDWRFRDGNIKAVSGTNLQRWG